MKHYRITIPLPPQGKGRGRAVRIGAGVRVITPAKTRNYEATVADLARAAVGDLLLEGPLGVKIWAVFPRSQELCKVYKKTGRPKHPTAWLWAHRVRIDVDNIAKTILDSLNGVAWVDDRQVADLEIHKVLTELVQTPDGWRQAAPRVEIQIVEYPPVAHYWPPAWITAAPVAMGADHG